MTENARLAQRLSEYADARLSPDPLASGRTRARVMAIAHRQAALARADAGLVVVPAIHSARGPVPRRRGATGAREPAIRRSGLRIASVILAACLILVAGAGTAFAAQPGAPLYKSRVWIETLTLPSDPSSRVDAELGRLRERLSEIAATMAGGDAIGATAALDAYVGIVEQASTRILVTGDVAAGATLENGVRRNLNVLRVLAQRAPATGASGDNQIQGAIQKTIARTAEAADTITDPDGGDPQKSGDPGGGRPAGGSPSPSDRPTIVAGSLASPVIGSEPVPVSPTLPLGSPAPTPESSPPTENPTSEPTDPTVTPSPETTTAPPTAEPATEPPTPEPTTEPPTLEPTTPPPTAETATASPTPEDATAAPTTEPSTAAESPTATRVHPAGKAPVAT
ncbi:MAG: hypothetical protein WKF56_01790, partial [Candidatus Limnocylindrales bacterium]